MNKKSRKALMARLIEQDNFLEQEIKKIYDWYFTQYNPQRINKNLNQFLVELIRYAVFQIEFINVQNEKEQAKKDSVNILLNSLFSKKTATESIKMEDKIPSERSIKDLYKLLGMVIPDFGVGVPPDEIRSQLMKRLISTKLWKDIPSLVKDLETAGKAGNGCIKIAKDIRQYANISTGLNPQYLKKLEKAYQEYLKTSIKFGGKDNPLIQDIKAQILHIKQYASERVGPPYGTRATLSSWINKFEKNWKKSNQLDAFKDIAEKRTKYWAQRVARTENGRAYTDQYLKATDQSILVTGYNFNLSGVHPKQDICDTYAAGSPYPKGQVPKPPQDTHPNCFCYITEVMNRDIQLIADRISKEMGMSVSEWGGVSEFPDAVPEIEKKLDAFAQSKVVLDPTVKKNVDDIFDWKTSMENGTFPENIPYPNEEKITELDDLLTSWVRSGLLSPDTKRIDFVGMINEVFNEGLNKKISTTVSTVWDYERIRVLKKLESSYRNLIMNFYKDTQRILSKSVLYNAEKKTVELFRGVDFNKYFNVISIKGRREGTKIWEETMQNFEKFILGKDQFLELEANPISSFTDDFTSLIGKKVAIKDFNRVFYNNEIVEEFFEDFCQSPYGVPLKIDVPIQDIFLSYDTPTWGKNLYRTQGEYLIHFSSGKIKIDRNKLPKEVLKALQKIFDYLKKWGN